jgi:hypothetical protein
MFSGLEALQSFILAKIRQKVTLTQNFGENSLFFFKTLNFAHFLKFWGKVSP